MKNFYFAAFLLMGLAGVSCKSDKKASNTDSSETVGQTTPAAPEEKPYKDATLAELSGSFADGNYPDKGFWKKFTVKLIAGNKVEVTFSSSTIAGSSGCNFRGTGDYANGYIKTPVNPGVSNPTYLTIRMLTNNDIFVGAEGGDQPNPSDVLSLFCITPTMTSIGGIYNRVKE